MLNSMLLMCQSTEIKYIINQSKSEMRYIINQSKSIYLLDYYITIKIGQVYFTILKLSLK